MHLLYIIIIIIYYIICIQLLYRKVQNESVTGSSTSHRVRTTLTVSVESVDFDTQACLLRLKGRNIEENDYVKVGNFLIFL